MVAWVPAFFLLWLAIVTTFGIPSRCRREFMQRKDLRRRMTSAPDEGGFQISTEVLSATRPWTDYTKWREGRALFLMYMSDTMFQVLPKRFFALEADIEAFRALLARKVPRREG